eukprot:4741407-Prymnesium_polylepis.1
MGAFENTASADGSDDWEGRGVALRSSVEQAIPRVRQVVAFGFEYSTMPGCGRSMWYGRCTLAGRGGCRFLRFGYCHER